MTKRELTSKRVVLSTRKKYDWRDAAEDKEVVRRLTAKHGSQWVREVASEFERQEPKVQTHPKKKSPGRPLATIPPAIKWMHFADWINETANELREAGYKAPVNKARMLARWLTTRDRSASKRITKAGTISRQHKFGRSLLKEYCATLEDFTRTKSPSPPKKGDRK
jgi:hypothetical protein